MIVTFFGLPFLILLQNLKFDRGFAEITENFLERVEIKKRLNQRPEILQSNGDPFDDILRYFLILINYQ